MADSLLFHIARTTTHDTILSSASAIQIHDSVLSCIGSTPLVRLDRLAATYGLRCNLLAKLEYFNAGGSVKDRIALRMVEEAEKEGKLIKGKSVVVEATSGNTGVGLALACAVKGYQCVIVLPEKMSREKINTIKALGAKIIRTPTEAASDSFKSHISVAHRLKRSIPDGIILDQYTNPNNPLAHYDATGGELIAALEASSTASPTPDHTTPVEVARPLSPPSRSSTGIADVLVVGAGTGGTLTGISRRLKERWGAERVLTIGVDPFGSILARPENLNVGGVHSYKIEGIGYDFVPKVLDHDVVDIWRKGTDEEGFEMAREVMRREGVLCGGSSGQALAAAVGWLKSEEGWRKVGGVEGKNVVVVCPDSIRNYITKEWLFDEGEKQEYTEEELVEKLGNKTC